MQVIGSTRPFRALRLLSLLPVLVALSVGAAPARAENPAPGGSQTLAEVQARGYVLCGVHRSGAGLAEIRVDGEWAGYFIEYCKIVAAAALGDGDAMRIVEIDDLSARLALRHRQVDVVISAIRDVEPDADSANFAFLTSILTDQQVLVTFQGELETMRDIPAGLKVCSSNHPVISRNLEAVIGNEDSALEVVNYNSIDGLFNAFFQQRCDAISHHHYAILAQNLLRSPQRTPACHTEFGLGRVVFSPMVCANDTEWLALVDAAVRAANHDETLGDSEIPFDVRVGFADRVHAIAQSTSAIYDRTLGHMGGQGFDPAVPNALGGS